MRSDLGAPVPSEDELAAIAAAYLVLAARDERPATLPQPSSRWRILGRPAVIDLRRAGATSRWNAAARLDV
jgi:hypothetical protein